MKVVCSLVLLVTIFMLPNPVSNISSTEVSAAICASNVYIDNDDPNYETTYVGSWTYQSNSASYRSDHRYTTQKDASYIWDFGEKTRFDGCTNWSFYAYVNNVNFVNRTADYADGHGYFGSLDQRYAPGGWNLVYTIAHPIGPYSVTNNTGVGTGADGIYIKKYSSDI